MSLHETAKALVASGKGILAADESTGTIGKRFESIGVENTEDNRRAYRDMLFTAPNLNKTISGVILYDETLRQDSLSGKPFVKLLEEQGVIPGIKVDMGAKPLAHSLSEKITEGLDGLHDRLAEYAKLGAKFAKWRAVIEIDATDRPTDQAIHSNAEALARYAAMCQNAGIVPIVEPEVIMDGGHDIKRCEAATGDVLRKVFEYLALHKVDLKGMLLKPNMVIGGLGCPDRNSPQEVAADTIECFNSVLPDDLAGVVFLSGGMSDEAASANLSAMNNMSPKWPLSFSYGRALQQACLKVWGGKKENVEAAQKVFTHRCLMNSLATKGQYSSEADQKVA